MPKDKVVVGRSSFHTRHLRGQVAIEFFLYIGIFIFILITAFSIITLIQNSEVPVREALVAREQGEAIADTLRLSVVAGEGFQYSMAIPKNLLGRPYEIVFNPGKAVMILTWASSAGQVSYIYSLPGYNYEFEGCLKNDKTLTSNECSSTIKIENKIEDGNNVLVVSQEAA